MMDVAWFAKWLIDNGCAEEKRGYGHISGEDLAEKLLENFEITEITPLTGGTYVYDPPEHRCWGPFEDDESANAFIEDDKYLTSWACVIAGPRGAVYRPEDY